MITQKLLAAFVEARAADEDARRVAAEIKHELDELTQTLLRAFDAGERTEPGPYGFAVEAKEGAIRPAWKDIYLDHMSVVHAQSNDTVEAAARAHCIAPWIRRVIVSKSPTPAKGKRK